MIVGRDERVNTAAHFRCIPKEGGRGNAVSGCSQTSATHCNEQEKRGKSHAQAIDGEPNVRYGESMAGLDRSGRLCQQTMGRQWTAHSKTMLVCISCSLTHGQHPVDFVPPSPHSDEEASSATATRRRLVSALRRTHTHSHAYNTHVYAPSCNVLA